MLLGVCLSEKLAIPVLHLVAKKPPFASLKCGTITLNANELNSSIKKTKEVKQVTELAKK
jgi:hypothetical protein